MAESGSWTFVSEDFDPTASPPLDAGEMEKLGGTAREGGREREREGEIAVRAWGTKWTLSI